MVENIETRRTMVFNPSLGMSILAFAAVIASATGFALLLNQIDYENCSVPVIYTVSIAVIAMLTRGYAFSIAAAFVSAVSVNFFYMSPRLGFAFADAVDFAMSILVLVLYTGTAMGSSYFVNLYRRRYRLSLLRVQRVTIAYDIMSLCTMSNDKKQILDTAKQKLHELLGCEAVLSATVRENKDGALEYAARANGVTYGYIYVKERDILIDDETAHMLIKMIAAQLAMAYERLYMSEERERIKLEAEAENVRGNLLRAVSHDLRTPLTGISAASSLLLDRDIKYSTEEKRRIVEDIGENASWLIQMVENLLTVTRIGEGNAQIPTTKEFAEKVIAQAMTHIKKRYPDREITAKVPQEILMLRVDAMLISQVIINLAENAFFHGKGNEPVSVVVEDRGDIAAISVIDRGGGINDEKFGALFSGYSERNEDAGDSKRGMGIGLSLCKTIVRLHGGDIWASNNDEGGATFTFTLPKGVMIGDD